MDAVRCIRHVRTDPRLVAGSPEEAAYVDRAVARNRAPPAPAGKPATGVVAVAAARTAAGRMVTVVVQTVRAAAALRRRLVREPVAIAWAVVRPVFAVAPQQVQVTVPAMTVPAWQALAAA